MTMSELNDLLNSLKTKKPIRLKVPGAKIRKVDGFFVDKQEKDVASIEHMTDEGWEHLMTVPNGHINRYRDPGYVDDNLGVAHQSLYGLSKKLIDLNIIESTEKHKFF